MFSLIIADNPGQELTKTRWVFNKMFVFNKIDGRIMRLLKKSYLQSSIRDQLKLA